MEIKRFWERKEAFDFLVIHFFQVANQSISTKGVFNVAVSGGSSPAPFFKELINQASQFYHWNKVNFFWVDERWVSFENKESNFGEASRLGLTTIPAQFYPFQTDVSEPKLSIEKYQEELKRNFIDQQGFDFVILGAGTDEHTASIFHSNLTEAKSAALAFHTIHPTTGQIRLSISMPLITQSHEVVLLLLGAEKIAILKSLSAVPSTGMSPVQTAILTSKKSMIVTDIND
ncbi:MAG: 6-phosphogluconolactonase [Cyclobacteriaceae bacterium]|nr:6-phosphogluconolactonase [Cyclobacteriaceae bacterium]